MQRAQSDRTRPDEDGFSQFFAEGENRPNLFDPALEPDVQKVLIKLLKSYERLRVASYRIGYLESRLKRCQEAARTLVVDLVPNKVQQLNIQQPERSPSEVSRNMAATGSVQMSSIESDNIVTEPSENIRSWWHALADSLVGSDRPRGRSKDKQEYCTDYHELIRRGLSR